MTETTDWQLIKRHVQRHTEADAQAAFGALVHRHMDMVYGTCLRALGEPALAEDAAQAVFLILARKAPAFRPGTTLPSWLFQTALLTANNVRRRERRRQAREQKVVAEMASETPQAPPPGWADMEPLLNDALASLPPAQRGLVLERFLEGRPLAEIGAALGVSEDAARMRLNRALDRLRRFFAIQGVALSAAALAALLPLAVRPAPARCAEALLRSAHPPVQTIAQGVIRTMNLKRLSLHLGAAALVAVLSIGTTSAVRVHTRAEARAAVAAKQEDQARALAVLNRMYATYTAMHSFRCNVADRTPDGLEQVGSYEIERPDRIRFERATLINTPALSGKALVVSDGSNLFATCTENGAFADRYAKVPLSHSESDDLWAFGGIPGQGYGGDRGMPGVALGQRLLPYTHTEPPQYSLGKPMLLDAPGVRARMVDVVIARLPYLPRWKGAGEVVTFYIGQSDHLLCMLTDAQAINLTAWSTRTETYSSIQVNPKLPASDFVFTPPPGTHEVHNTLDLFPNGRK